MRIIISYRVHHSCILKYPGILAGSAVNLRCLSWKMIIIIAQPVNNQPYCTTVCIPLAKAEITCYDRYRYPFGLGGRL